MPNSANTSNIIEKIDKNLAVNSTISKDGLIFFDAASDLFYLNGLLYDARYRRIPEEIANSVSEGIYALHTNTAGGSLHFKTNSRRIAIKCVTDCITKVSHMPHTGVCGFDMYVENKYEKTFIPPYDITDGYESMHEFTTDKFRNITINFPLYNNITKLYIGLDINASCESLNPYGSKLPIVYYGSSITQGGCASRPGMSYPSIISRNLSYPHINLGFSGSALGEPTMAEYISSLSMSAFVMDYDHNAPNAKHLKKTHETFFKVIRNANPVLPIIMISQHSHDFAECDLRRDIIRQTYQNAKTSGDDNVYFLDGLTLFPNNDCTVDGCHPTDYGFANMADKIGAVLENILM